VNSANVIGDHGSGVGWNSNTADTGLVFNGDNVTMYGLFVEHYQKYQTIWNGNGGRTYLYQNEMPYDPPNQAAWMNGSTQGYAACKVGNSVTGHEAWGLGSYCFFSADNSVVAARAFEVPNTAPGQPACAVVAAAVTHAGSFCRRSGEPGSRTGVLCGNLVTAGVTLVVVKP